jgi:hypothetical protein
MRDIDRIEKHSEKVTESGCWIWMGAISNSGYGLAHSDKRNKTASAHRVSYEAFIGDIPKGMIIAHACDNRLCVNPNHLWLATHKQNSQDMVKKNRSAFGEKCGKSKLKEFEVSFIKETKLSQRKIATMFSISKTTVGDIRRGKTWTTRG